MVCSKAEGRKLTKVLFPHLVQLRTYVELSYKVKLRVPDKKDRIHLPFQPILEDFPGLFDFLHFREEFLH